MMTDPISDFLTRIRNGQLVNHTSVSAPSSKMKVHIAEILKSEGYIADFRVEPKNEKQKSPKLVVDLKYDDQHRPIIIGLKRVSKPGLRVYKGAKDLPEVQGGMGTAVVSTSKGVMTDAQARAANMGGEVLCYVW